MADGHRNLPDEVFLERRRVDYRTGGLAGAVRPSKLSPVFGRKHRGQGYGESDFDPHVGSVGILAVDVAYGCAVPPCSSAARSGVRLRQTLVIRRPCAIGARRHGTAVRHVKRLLVRSGSGRPAAIGLGRLPGAVPSANNARAMRVSRPAVPLQPEVPRPRAALARRAFERRRPATAGNSLGSASRPEIPPGQAGFEASRGSTDGSHPNRREPSTANRAAPPFESAEARRASRHGETRRQPPQARTSAVRRHSRHPSRSSRPRMATRPPNNGHHSPRSSIRPLQQPGSA